MNRVIRDPKRYHFRKDSPKSRPGPPRHMQLRAAAKPEGREVQQAISARAGEPLIPFTQAIEAWQRGLRATREEPLTEEETANLKVVFLFSKPSRH